MTEITKINEYWYKPNLTRHQVDHSALILAAVGGPLMVALLGFPIFLIPVFALFLGGPLYLIIGIPVMMYVLRHHEARPGIFANAALCATLALCALCTLFFVLTGFPFPEEEKGLLVMYAFFSFIFAPLWGSTSGWIYTCWRREIYSHTVTL